MNPFRSQMEREAWDKVKGLAEFSRQTLVAKGINDNTARDFIKRWVQGGRIDEMRVVGTLRWYAPKGALPVENDLPAPAKDRSPEANMWRAMRQLRTDFSALDIAEHAITADVTVTEAQARTYCRQLLKAGYLAVHQTAIHRVRPAKYRLVINTGPRAPLIKRVVGVLDQNEDKFLPLDPGVS